MEENGQDKAGDSEVDESTKLCGHIEVTKGIRTFVVAVVLGGKEGGWVGGWVG